MKKPAFICIIALTFWSCATFSQNYKLGSKELIAKNWDKAIAYYEKAALENPKNSVYRLALLRAKMSASLVYLARARSLSVEGKKVEALATYKKALAYDPSNRRLVEEARRLAEGKPEEKEAELASIELPIKLKTARDKIDLKFPQEISLRSIFEALGKYSEINLIFDESFRDLPFSIDLSGLNFEQAVNTLCMATKNFFRIINDKTILIIPDLPQNRMKYELVGIKTFYLSNITAQDIQQHIMQQLRSRTKVPTVSINKELNSITIRDTPDKLELAGKLIRIWDKPKGEVIIDLEIMEVSRQKIRKLGLDLTSRSIGLQYNDESVSGSGFFDLAGLDFSKIGNYQIVFPSALLDFLESEADTKIIAQPRLRGVHGEKMEYIVGDEIPIPRTTFSPIAAGGVSSQPITNFEYKNVGIEVYITPTIHFEDEVTLELELKVKALGGSGFGDLPIITTREVKNIIRLKDGETNLLAGLLKDEERKTLKGIAGLKSIPLLGSLFSSTDQTIQQTDVVLTITPYIIRKIPLSKEDNKPLWIPLEDSLSGSKEGQVSGLVYPGTDAIRGAVSDDTTREREDKPGVSRVTLNPPRYEGPKNRNFRINVNLSAREEIQNMSLNITFNSQVIQLAEITKGNVIQRLGEKPSFLEHINNPGGTCTIGLSTDQIDSGFKGTGRIVTLVFKTVGSGESVISITGLSAHSPSGDPVHLETNESHIRVR